jgi:hypothetical protein
MKDESVIRIHSSDIDEVFMLVLYYLGNVDGPTSVSSTIRLLHKYKKDKELFSIYMSVFELYSEHFKLMLDEAEKSGSKTLNPEKFIKECARRHGKKGLKMCSELIHGNSEDMHCKLSSYRRFEWSDAIDLENLFKSESLESQYGEAPLIMVQCKRYKNKIDRTVVKALWADVQWEKAGSGLIVTTSSLARGAQNDCVARGYNIKQADRNVICTWLENMRTPGAGIFMGK